jgi:hypothetical protein
LNANDIETFQDEENNPALGSKINIQVGIKP